MDVTLFYICMLLFDKRHKTRLAEQSIPQFLRTRMLRISTQKHFSYSSIKNFHSGRRLSTEFSCAQLDLRCSFDTGDCVSDVRESGGQ